MTSLRKAKKQIHMTQKLFYRWFKFYDSQVIDYEDMGRRTSIQGYQCTNYDRHDRQELKRCYAYAKDWWQALSHDVPKPLERYASLAEYNHDAQDYYGRDVITQPGYIEDFRDSHTNWLPRNFVKYNHANCEQPIQ